MWTKQFWVDAAERAIRTFAQALIAILGAGAVNILTVDWVQALSVGAGAAILSILTSIASSGFGVKGTPSLLPEAAASESKNLSEEVETTNDIDAADADIEQWNAANPDFTPDVVDADPDPADVRDTNPKDDAK